MPTKPHTAAPANRLAHETSPYLLQHANNPVDWYPWGDEALEKARAEDKPIFLSVGYSTCYWCHVMERRCFEVEAIAELMNEHHINIKVDREERPDVDELYMAAVQIMNQGQGGWPMSVWIDPHTLKPFYAGTYFPPENHYGRPGFPHVIQQLASIWRDRRRDVEDQANTVADRMAALLAAPPDVQQIGAAQVNEAVNQLMSIYDRTHGGFGSAPKFPQPVFLELLLAAGDDTCKHAVKHTLDRMAIGGMYDQVGGGFHRYSVDQHWLVPHFEKMLYDNGQLASLYARAAEFFDDDFYREITEETLDYVLREMTHEQGGFFSAQDAEVNAREGENYLWTADEVRSALHEAGLDDLIDFALHTYGLDKGPNFRDPHDESAEPRNVLHLIDRPEPLARALDVSVEDFNSRVSRINETLLAARDQREQPATDDKILAGWNGLMIAAFAEGGRVLDETRYLDAAERAARFIIEHVRDERGELCRSHCKGEVRVKGFLEDYALLAHGLLALHNATGERNWLDTAGEFVIRAQRIFRNEKTGGYFTTRSDQTDLFVRLHAAFDGAVPSGPSVMLHNLLDLYERTGDTTYLDEATQTLASLSSRIERSPTGLSLATVALHRFVEKWPDRLPQQSSDSHADAEPVSAELNTNAISLTGSGHVTVELRLRMADGYHINAHEPGDTNLQPLRIELEGEGATVDVKYPAGESLENAAFADAPIGVHSGDIVVPLHICESGEPRGEHHVVITCQPCTDQMCLEPRRIRLPIEITPA